MCFKKCKKKEDKQTSPKNKAGVYKEVGVLPILSSILCLAGMSMGLYMGISSAHADNTIISADKIAHIEAKCDTPAGAEACNNLAFMYQSGIAGLPKNDIKAMSLLKKSCHAGYKLACDNLGSFEGEKS